MNQDSLLQALVTTCEQISSLERVALEDDWFDKKTLVRIFSYQIQKGSSFEGICQELGLWNPEIATKAALHQEAVRDWFIRVLCKEDGMTVETVITDDSRDRKNLSSGANPKTQISTQPIEWSPSFAPVEPSMIDDFCEVFDDYRRRDIESNLLRIETHTRTELSQLDGDLSHLYREFHTIKSSARFVKAELIERLLHLSEDILGFAQKFHTRLSPEDYEQLTTIFLKMLDEAWNLRITLEKTSSEEAFWTSESTQKQYLATYTALSQLKENLNSRGYKVDLSTLSSAF